MSANTGLGFVISPSMTITIDGTASVSKIESFGVQDSITVVEQNDTDGEWCGAISGNHNREVMISIIPSNTTNALAAGQVDPPVPGSIIVLSSFAVDALNGSYLYMGDFTFNVSNDLNPGKVTFRGKRNLANNVTVAIAAE